MLFNSWEFLVFLAATLFLYYLPPLRRFQLPLLIAASFVFYGFHAPWLLLLLVVSITLNAVASYQVYFDAPERARLWSVLGVVLNLAILAFFKYSGLLYTTLTGGQGSSDGLGHFLTTIPLPIGISFFTFQGISLVLDTARMRREGGTTLAVSRNFMQHWVDIAFFKAFFPQLISGPITKAKEFIPQISPKAFKDVDWGAAFSALVLGYFLKMVVADNLNAQTYYIQFPYFEAKSSLTLLALLLGYSCQIFADFAGYSTIAIGVALLFGYRLPLNFNYPYISRSFSEFWRRWHISLSSWLRDYLYIPLGGNRRGAAWTYFNLMTVMVLGGLWHGAAWSYAIWGLWHGLALSIERFLERHGLSGAQRWMEAPKALFVFAYVTLGWLLFKLPDFRHVLAYLRAMAHNMHMPHDYGILLAVALYSSLVGLLHVLYLLRPWLADARRAPFTRPATTLAFGFLLFLIFRNSGDSGAFIYFQF